MRSEIKTPLSACLYLPDQQWQLHYELTPDLHPIDYMGKLKEGWRRVGPAIFRPECPTCHCCRSLRIAVMHFRPSRSQRRAWKRNENTVEIKIGAPSISPERLELLAKFHEHGEQTKGWPSRTEEDGGLDLYVLNPFPTEEWSYWIDGRLVGVGYVDALSEGLSAIYFFHDPDQHQRSLGTFNILNVIEEARQRALPHVYLGYYVEGCRSLEYKARFRPNEILCGGRWEPFSS